MQREDFEELGKGVAQKDGSAGVVPGVVPGEGKEEKKGPKDENESVY